MEGLISLHGGFGFPTWENDFPFAGARGEEKQEKKASEEATEDPMEKALSVMCPLSRFKGKTLGEVLREDPSVINYLAGKGADKYKETHPKVVESAKLLCEYAKKKSKQTEETAA